LREEERSTGGSVAWARRPMEEILMDFLIVELGFPAKKMKEESFDLKQ